MLKLLIALTALSAITPLYATETETPPTRRVHTVDLDLATPTGIAKLDTRIARAAAEVCLQDDGNELALRLIAERCRRSAIAATDEQRNRIIAQSRERGAMAVASTRSSTSPVN